MKNFFTLSLLFLSLSGLFAQSECTVKIGFVANKTNPITYSFKTDPFTDGAKYYWNFSDGQISDNPNPTKSFKETGAYSVTVKVSKNDQVCTGELEFRYETGTVNTPVILTGKGKVKKLDTNDGCGLLITLDNGTIIVPKEMVSAFEFKDGQYVELAYELFRDKSSGCPSGIYAKIDKIAEIVQTVCNVPITFTKSTSVIGIYTFKTAEQPAGAKYLWYFGDQGTSTEASPTVTFNTNGTYSITLKVTDTAGKTCSNVLRTAFEGKTSPVLSAKGKVKKLALAGCDLVISLDNGTTLIPAKMVPDFVLKENQYVELTYEKLGEKITTCNEGFEAKILTIKEITATPVILSGKGKVVDKSATTGCGLVITLENGTYLIAAEMVPAFTLKAGQYVEFAYEVLKDKPSTCAPGVMVKINKISEIVQTVCNVPITFTKSTSTIGTYTFKTAEQPAGASYLWYFGDQGTSTEASPTFTFNTNGTYSITLKVTDTAGKTCSNVLRTAFEGKTSPVLSAKGKVKKLALAGCDLVISLDNGTTLIPAKMVPDFVLKENQYVELTYEKLGEKITTCNEGFEAKILTIQEITTTTTCKAYFTASNQVLSDAAVTKKMVFANQSVGDLKECLWYFGDNTTGTSTSATVTHEYINNGEYKVCLVITTISGCKSDYCTTVKVGTSTTTTTGCGFDIVIKPKAETPNTFLFYAVSKTEIKTWAWKFGDGKASDAQNPEHAYEKTGTYEVSCTVTTAAGCTTSRTVKYTVLTSPLANCKGAISLMLFDPTDNQCNGKATVKLFDENSKEITNASFIWSDGRTGSTVEKLCPDKTYAVQAIIEGLCQKSTSFTMLSKPIWRASTINGQSNFTVITPKDGVNYEWDFGNGVSLKGAEVNYDFEKDGVYNVTLKAVNGADYSESLQQVVVMKSATGTAIFNKSELKVFPNPVKDVLKIDFGNPVQGNMHLEIMNITGKRVLTSQLSGEGHYQTSIDVKDLHPGIYFVRVTAGKQLVSDYKFIKAD
jgi:PKD repeat protein